MIEPAPRITRKSVKRDFYSRTSEQSEREYSDTDKRVEKQSNFNETILLRATDGFKLTKTIRIKLK